MIRLNSKQLRDIPAEEAQEHSSEVKRNPIILIVENVYDTYNIGGLFRLADALAVEKIYLCGDMETPPHHKIEKASVGTYKIVPWEYKPSALEAIRELRELEMRNEKLEMSQVHPPSIRQLADRRSPSEEGISKNLPFQGSTRRGRDVVDEIAASTTSPRNDDGHVGSLQKSKQSRNDRYTILAVEQAENSIPYTSVEYSSPVALVVGNETFGVTEETLKAVDHIVEIPMWGINKSLNVIVSAAIVSYHVMGEIGGRS